MFNNSLKRYQLVSWKRCNWWLEQYRWNKE